MEFTRVHKWIVVLALALLGVSFLFSRFELPPHVTTAVGLAEVLTAALIGVWIGVTAAKKS